MGLLRFFLALAVVCAHTPLGFQFTGGKVAVQTFFIISGFYIALILRTAYSSNRLFWTNRLLRLLPLYYVVAILTLFAVFVLGARVYGNFDGFFDLPVVAIVFLIFTNLTLFFQDFTMFLAVNGGVLEISTNFNNSSPPLFHYLLVPQAWSLGVEISFYLLAPFLCKRSNLSLLIIIFVAVLVRLALYSAGLKSDPWNYRFFPVEIVFFLVGVLSFRFYSRFKNKISDVGFGLRLFVVVFVLLLTFSFAHIPVSKGVLMLVYFVIVVLALPVIFFTSKDWVLDRFVGELSYPIYMTHMLVIALLDRFYLGQRDIYFGLLVCALTVFFSVIVYWLVEKPVGVIRERRKIAHGV